MTAKGWYATHREQALAEHRAYYDANSERIKKYVRMRKYGLPPEAYDEMLSMQSGLCAACGVNEPGGKGTFHTDHDPGTGKVRGLLCHSCNIKLQGTTEESIQQLTALLEYLKGNL